MTIMEQLEQISKSAKTGDQVALKRLLGETIALIKTSDPLMKELSQELSIWSTKLDVILKESAGREGMAKHANYWAEKLKNV